MSGADPNYVNIWQWGDFIENFLFLEKNLKGRTDRWALYVLAHLAKIRTKLPFLTSETNISEIRDYTPQEEVQYFYSIKSCLYVYRCDYNNAASYQNSRDYLNREAA